MQAFLQSAFDNGALPQRTASGALIVRSGARYRTIVNRDGQQTPAGERWETISGTTLPQENFDSEQQPSRDGNTEYIRVRGEDRITRTYDPATNGWRYTRLGRRFYRSRQIQWVVQVPSTHRGTRSNGQPYSRDAYFPVEAPIALRATLTQAQRDARIRAEVTRLFPGGVLAEFSEERVTLDNTRPWSINEMITEPGEQGPETTVVSRPLGTRPSVSSLLFPEQITEAAWDTTPDRLCVARQIAQIRMQPFDEVCCEMDQVATELGEEDWRVHGATSKLIFAYARRNELGACCLHGDRVVETLPGPRPLVWAIHGSHAYFYANKRVCRQLAARIPCAFQKLKREGLESTTPELKDWQPWEGEARPGHFYAEDMDEARADLLKVGRHAKVTMRDEQSIKSLIYTFTVCDDYKGVCVIHSLPQEWREIKAWIQNLPLNIAYRGEGLPNITWKVLQALIRKRPREHLTGQEKHDLMQAHDFVCALCGSKSSVEFDHIHALRASYGPQDFQPCCSQCHAEKTFAEPREWEQDVLSSHFSEYVWQHYVMSPRSPPLVHRLKAVSDIENLSIADVRRCRKRALEFNVHCVPVVAPTDDIEPTCYALGDLMFCTKAYKCCVRQYGYTGPGWMHRCQAEWLLYVGVVSWQDLPYKLNALGRLPAELFKGPLEIMEKAWENGLGKQSVNAMIGLWCRDQCVSYKIVTSEHPGDAPANSLKRIFKYDGGSVTDYIMKAELTTTVSMRPLWDLCMGTEATRVGQMLHVLRKQRAQIYELKTDSVLYKLPKKKKGVLETLTFKNLSVRDLFEPAGQRRLDQHYTLVPVQSDELVFRVSAATGGDPLMCDPKGPRRSGTYSHKILAWRDLTEAEAREAIVNGQSLLVLGLPGVGKSFFCKDLVQQLTALGKRVDITSKTHTASARAGGVTADCYVRRHIQHGACLAQAIWVDELFQLELGLWAQLQKLKGRQWILSGDQFQFSALFDQWKGTAVPEDTLLKSRLLHQLCGGNRITLTQCRRSERELFEWYASLVPGQPLRERALPDVLREARARFSFQGPARHNLVLSHRRRVRINAQCMQAFKPDVGARFIRASSERGQLNAAQNLYVWVGLELLGCSRNSKKIRNNVLYTVKEVQEAAVVVVSEGGETISLTDAQVAEMLRLSFARTYASCQGTEFDGTLRLWDCQNRNFTHKHLYVALSRAKAAHLIDIAA